MRDEEDAPLSFCPSGGILKGLGLLDLVARSCSCRLSCCDRAQATLTLAFPYDALQPGIDRLAILYSQRPAAYLEVRLWCVRVL